MKFMRAGIILATIFAFCQSIRRSQLEDDLYSGNLRLNEDLARQVFKKYRSESQMDQLFPIFYPNLQKIVNHNLKNSTWTMGVNEFAFITDEEFNQKFLGASPQNCSATAETTLRNKIFSKKVREQDLPNYVNWTAENKVSSVKDQRQCGSCWTFSATGALESHWSILYDTWPPYFSEQQLVDCAQDFENNGCAGGLPSQAFEYIKYNGGLEFENTYPYAAIDGDCTYNSKQNGIKLKGGSFNITFQDEQQLTEKVANVGPVSVAYQVADDFKLYESGIYNNPNCSTKPEDVNHAVLATGYGVQEGTDYWYIKNSWGKTWGMEGYFMMVRGENMCGIADCASYPLIDTEQSTYY